MIEIEGETASADGLLVVFPGNTRLWAMKLRDFKLVKTTTCDPDVGSVAPSKDNPLGQQITMHFDPGIFEESDASTITIAHEGSHAADASAWVASGFSPGMNPNPWDSETRAFRVSVSIAQASAFDPLGYPAGPNNSEVYIWKPAWRGEQVNAAISSMLRDPSGFFRLNPKSNVVSFKRNTHGDH